MPTITPETLLPPGEEEQAKVLRINAQDYPVHSVTIFRSSKAEVVRQFPIQLKVGQNRIEIMSLPGTLDSQTVRVSGLISAQVHDVACQSYDGRQCLSPSDNPTLIDALRTKRQQIVEMREHSDKESQILLDYSRTIHTQYTSPNDLKDFLSLFDEHEKRRSAEAARIDGDLRDLDIKIRREQDKCTSRKDNSENQRFQLNMVIVADVELNTDLKLSYVVSNASWKPIYELHVTTHDGKPSQKVELKYRAQVHQNTEEDWNGAQLHLSTSHQSKRTMDPKRPTLFRAPYPDRSQSVAQVHTSTTSLHNPRRAIAGEAVHYSNSSDDLSVRNPRVQYTGPGQLGDASTVKSRVFNSMAASIIPPAQAQDRLQGAADHGTKRHTCLSSASSTFPANKDTALFVAYKALGRCIIPSDGLDHTVCISELEFESVLRYIAVPQVAPVVYLQCELKNTSEYWLLPGTVNVILDGSFVSQTAILDVFMGDTFNCTLGVDPAIIITYIRKATHSDTIKESALFRAKKTLTTSHSVMATLTNKHSFDLHDIFIQEALPMTNRENGPDDHDENASFGPKAHVVLRKPAGLAEAKYGEEVALYGKQACTRGSISASDTDSMRSAECRMKARWIKEQVARRGNEEGQFEWFGTLRKGEEVQLEAAWDVEVTEGTRWYWMLTLRRWFKLR